ncbi:glycosyltransferase [Chloroflexota bacterium]
MGDGRRGQGVGKGRWRRESPRFGLILGLSPSRIAGGFQELYSTMRVLLKVDALAGGIKDYTSFLCQSLLKRGVKCEITYKPGFLPSGVDLIHYQLGNSSWKVGNDILFNRRKLVVITLHDIFQMRWLPRLIYPLILKGRLCMADSVVLHSQNARKLFRERYGATLASKVTVIPHGINIASIDQYVARQRLGLPGEAFIFVAAGARRYKGIEQIIEAFSGLSQEDVKLIIVGGRKKKYIEGLRQTCEDARIRFWGFATEEELDYLLAAADIIVQYKSRSVGESSGILSRVIGLRKPVISSNIEPIPEDLGGCGILIEPDSPSALRECMLEVVSNRGPLDCAVRGMVSIAADRSWEAVADKHIALYNSLLKSESRGQGSKLGL